MKILLFILVAIVIIVGSIFLVFTLKQKKPTKLIRYSKIESELFDQQDYESKISLSDSLQKLMQNDVLDKQKINSLYSEQPELQKEFSDLINDKDKPIHLTDKNAGLYLNILWPIGLANQMKINKMSPLKQEKNINSFASTGGWSLGEAKEGGKYFNKYQIVKLTSEQEKLVLKIASNIYRPCCNNNTFFQDCNHGSAMLGLLELGASQGLSEDKIYQEALKFNSFWFTNEYLVLANYFQMFRGQDWLKVDPKVVLSSEFSSQSGWRKINQTLTKNGFRLPRLLNSSGC